MLIENDKVKKVQIMGLIQQTLADAKQGLKTMEVWRATLPPGSETPVHQHHGEVIVIPLKGKGRAVVDQESFDLVPDTTLVIPAQASRQVANPGAEDLVILIVRGLVNPAE